MKKFNKFGYASAMLLATAMGFTGCSSDDEMENINPTYDGNSVKTQFSISLTQKAKDKNGARMTNEQVGNGNFTGIKNVKLYHFNAPVTDSSQIVGIVPNITAINSFNYQNTGQTKLNGNVYDIQIPTGTSHFLFYGESNLASIGSTIATYPATPADSDVDDITFTPAKILDDTKLTNFGTAYTNIINTLNAVYAALTNNALPASVKAEATTLALLRTASSEHILALVEEIYNSVAVQGDDLPEGADKDAVAAALAAIVNAGFTVNGSELTWTAETNFPTAFGLPSGAVAVKFNNGQFEKNEDALNTSDGSQGDYKMYAKPANLMYYANSPAAVRNTSYFDMDGAASVSTATEADWEAVARNFTPGAVTATTRSVILKEQVNYGVAQLQTSVKFAAGGIEDSKSTQETPNYVTIPAAGFQVTGILVGNQKQVGWDFAPIGSDVYTIYDNVMANAIMAKQADEYSAVNYTLVYESQDATSADDTNSDIRVALELQNGDTEFYGVGGQKVPARAKFYLVGELHVGNQYADDAPVKSVFKQDYITTAKFTISSLKNAYNVIPDLATPQMEFGLSVDLGWKDGLDFVVAIP